MTRLYIQYQVLINDYTNQKNEVGPKLFSQKEKKNNKKKIKVPSQ